jgi:AraC-like DNA-binding protein
VDVDQLGLPMDTVRAATRQLHASPIYPLVRDHITRVLTDTQRLAGSAAASQVGTASVELMHALVVSAAADPRRLGDAMHTSLSARVQAYVRHHLRDPELTPQRIAAANGLSIRALYALYEGLGVSLEQSIIRQRLNGVRTDLSASRQRYGSIAATARAWGFTNMSFFASRFRQAFGVTPRQWRSGIRPDR